MSFEKLGLCSEILKSIEEKGYVNPTEIQEEVIPILLGTKTDLIGLAQTGTGKTAAFGLPMLNSINPTKSEVQGLIIAPTRELVQQIKKQLFNSILFKWDTYKRIRVSIYDGVCIINNPST